MDNNLLSRARAKLEREMLGIENRTDLTDDQKASRIVVLFSTVCAGAAVQPIPFADIFILTPLQAFMGTRLAAIRGVRVSEQESTDIIKQVMGVVGMGLVAQQLGIAAAKILFPIFGGVATIPVVFGLTYAIGTVMDKYFVARAAGRKLSPEEIRSVWKQAKAAGQKAGKEREQEIRRDGSKD
jgi:uncharacterized protein (DUF697 family)